MVHEIRLDAISCFELKIESIRREADLASDNVV